MRVEIALPLKKSLDYYLKKIEEVNGINFLYVKHMMFIILIKI